MDDEPKTTEHEIDEFFELVTKKFGDKFTMQSIELTDEVKAQMLAGGWTEKMLMDLQVYKQVWVKSVTKYGNESIVECPACGEDLSGLFGVFTWGLVNGQGYCGNCNKTTFQFYHRFYDGDQQMMFTAYALIGF